MADEGEQPRVLEADRRQVCLRPVDLEQLLPADHRARLIWSVVEALDLSAFYDAIKARGSVPGRPAIDPKILLSLWLYATSEGLGSARQLERLCTRDDAYRWICGGVEPNHHTLSDFRVGHGAKLDALLTQLLAALVSQGILRLTRVAQDGMRVRAHAGGSSFRRAPKLKACLAAAQAQVATLRAELEAAPGAASARERAARERAAQERQARVERALKELPKLAQVQARQARRYARAAVRAGKAAATREPRVSPTDPEARIMRMGAGGYRPAVNAQFATDVESRIVTGVTVTNSPTEAGHLTAMVEEVEQRTGRRPEAYLCDGGYTQLAAIDAVERRGVEVYAPVPAPRRPDADPHARKPDDTDHTAAWRARMATEEAKQLYKLRGATAETIHADQRTWRGLRQLPVCGLAKAKCIVLWGVLLYNILRADVLVRALAG